MSDLNISYLEGEQIAGVIAKGLAVLYLEQPKFPIDFLAKWLLTYARNQQLKDRFKEEERQCQQLLEQEQVRINQVEAQKASQEELQKKLEAEELDFKQTIISNEYHEELIQKYFCDYIATKLKLSGVYVCELDFPRKEFQSDKDDDENAHIDPNGTKLLRYMAASFGQEFLVDLTLLPETGVTYEALKELPPDDNGVIPVNTGIYVPDVVQDQRIVYHQWPKLGSFYAVPLVYNSCLQEGFLDACVEARTVYLRAKEEQRKEREAKEQEFEEQITQKTEIGEDVTALEQELKAYREGLEEVQEPSFQVQKREFVVCCDTLGLDREISEKDREYILNQVNLLSKSWEEKERQVFSADIDRQLKYIEQTGFNFKEQLDQFNQEEENFVEANLEKLEEIKERNEREYQYEVECLRLDKLREQLADKNFTIPMLALSESRVIKYPGIIQAGLYLLQFDKNEINIPASNLLNWRYTRTIFNEALVDRFLAYSHRGPKDVPKYPWSYVNRVQKRLEKFEQEAVDQYCLPLGRLLRMLNLICKLRKQDIEIRRAKIEARRTQISNLKVDVATIQEERAKQLQQEKDQLSPEDLEQFSQEEWDANWDAEHPLPEIPEDPQDEIDGDYEFEIQQ